jgi:hypothetical protein
MTTTKITRIGMKDQGLSSDQAREFTLILPPKPGGAQRIRERLKNYPAEHARLNEIGYTISKLW